MTGPLAPTDPLAALGLLHDAAKAFADAGVDPEQALSAALTALVEATGADAGAVARLDAEGDVHIVARSHLGRAAPLCRTVLRSVLQDEIPEARVILPPSSASVHEAAITSILCAPVRRQGRTLAAVYLDRRLHERDAFDDVARLMVASLSVIIGLAVDLLGRLETSERLRADAQERAELAMEAARSARDQWRFGALATESPAMARCLAAAERVARYDADVLILGETGTGKEFLARAMHHESRRRPGPFVAVNCAALPETLVESELFGHERGAFTGADRRHRGKFEQASGGTLFLDEVGDIPATLQPKLLRVLEDKRVTPVGSAEELAVDVRLVAATHKDLAAEVKAGRLREDLYYRLAVVTVTLPPLRDRCEDVPALARALLRDAACGVGRADLSFDDGALRALLSAPMPGNVRQLKNTIKRLCVMAEGPVITGADVERHALGESAAEPTAPEAGDAAVTGSLRDRVADAERSIIAAALKREGSMTKAARSLGMRKQSLHERCIRLGLPLPGR